MSCVRSPRSLLSPLPSFSLSTLIAAVWNAVRINLSAGPLCLLTESNTIFYTGEHEHGLHRFWGGNHRHDINKGFGMFCSALLYFRIQLLLNSMHICQKNEYVRIVYYQHFDFISTFGWEKSPSLISALVKSWNDLYKIGINFTNVAFYMICLSNPFVGWKVNEPVSRVRMHTYAYIVSVQILFNRRFQFPIQIISIHSSAANFSIIFSSSLKLTSVYRAYWDDILQFIFFRWRQVMVITEGSIHNAPLELLNQHPANRSMNL